MFSSPFQDHHVIIGGDFNIHHPLWGSQNSSPRSVQFVNHLNQSQFSLMNTKTPTRKNPSTDDFSAIDLSLISKNLTKNNWYVNQATYRECISDHYEIYYSITPKGIAQNDVYHSTWNLGSKSKWASYNKELRKQIQIFGTDRPANAEALARDLSE